MLPASLVLLNTCAIRENAEQKIWNRLETLSGMRSGKKASRRAKQMVVGVLGNEKVDGQRVLDGYQSLFCLWFLHFFVLYFFCIDLFCALGCMAERLKERLLERDRLVDLVCGPDAYRDLPRLVECVQEGEKAVNVQLSMDETYGKEKNDKRAAAGNRTEHRTYYVKAKLQSSIVDSVLLLLAFFVLF